jgi:multiple antibiotic resistance protein
MQWQAARPSGNVPARSPRASGATVNDVVNAFLLVYAGLFPIVNPIGSAPIFLGLTRRCTDEERHALASQVATNSFFLLVVSLFVGSYVLQFFGITLPVLRIAGGLVVTSFGWKLLHAGSELEDKGAVEAAGRSDRSADAFYPLTMPLTVGPGSISVAIALGGQRPAAATDLAHLALVAGGGLAGLGAIAATVFLSYRFAERLTAALGERGTNVLVRLSAFILLSIGVQILWNGASALLVDALETLGPRL